MGAVCLISCVSKKRPFAVFAKELYTSAWFRLAREYAEAFPQWGILSAKHGLLVPWQIVHPYDDFMGNKTKAQRIQWAKSAARDITATFPDCTQFVVLAGKAYREPLLSLLPAPSVVPMEGLGIGQQLAWLKKARASD